MSEANEVKQTVNVRNIRCPECDSKAFNVGVEVGKDEWLLRCMGCGLLMSQNSVEFSPNPASVDLDLAVVESMLTVLRQAMNQLCSMEDFVAYDDQLTEMVKGVGAPAPEVEGKYAALMAALALAMISGIRSMHYYLPIENVEGRPGVIIPNKAGKPN